MVQLIMLLSLQELRVLVIVKFMTMVLQLVLEQPLQQVITYLMFVERQLCQLRQVQP